jgi:hypothetical protein
MPTNSANRRANVARLRVATLIAAAATVCAWAAAPASAETCPNAQRRAEQPFGHQLPDCRAYEMVSPLNTNGQDAATSNAQWGPRAAVSGEAITYTSRGLFGEPAGGDAENQYLSHRGSEGWSTQSITPLHDPFTTEIEPPYEGDAFTPELTAGIANTNSPLVEGAAGGKEGGEYGLYVADLGGGSYRYVAPVKGGEGFAFGVSSDLSRVMLEKTMWVNGSVVPVMVTNEGAQIDGAVGAEAPADGFFKQKDSSQAVSSDGSQRRRTRCGTAICARECGAATEPDHRRGSRRHRDTHVRLSRGQLAGERRRDIELGSR